MPEWLSTLAQYAPRVAAAVATGGTSEIAAAALSIGGELLSGKPATTQLELQKAVESATPDQLLALKQADNQFAIREAEILAEDRASTREAVQQSEKYAALFDWVARRVLTWNLPYIVGLVALQVLILVITMKYMPTEAALITATVGNIAGMIITNLLKERADVVSLLFGSMPNSDGAMKPPQVKLPAVRNNPPVEER